MIEVDYDTLLALYDLLRDRSTRSTPYLYCIEYAANYIQRDEDIIIAAAYQYATERVFLVAIP